MSDRKDGAERPYFGPADTAGMDYGRDLGDPGKYPYTRGLHAEMYRQRLWTMRQYAGFSSAEESNRRYRYLLARGTTGLSVAFDLPTQIGYDSDHTMARGEVGRVGVAIASREDMRRLFAEIPLDRVTTSMTINSTAAILLAFYLAVAEEQAHVFDRCDRDADAADLAARQRVVGIAPHLRRQVERDREAGLALREQVVVALVGLARVAEAGVLAHGPEAAAVHRRLRAAGEGILPGLAELRLVVGVVLRRPIDVFERDAGVGLELVLAELRGRRLLFAHVKSISFRSGAIR